MSPLLHGTPEISRRAAYALLETRLPEAFSLVGQYSPAYLAHLPQVGFAERDQRRLYPSPPRHLIFPPEYVAQLWPLERWSYSHPTWAAEPVAGPSARFGGEATGVCADCGGRMNHILTLDPPPPDLGIAALPRLSLATCLTCLAPLDPLSYKHGTDGTAVSHSSGRVIAPEVRIASLIETTVTLAILDKRWRWQGWTDSENLNRLGGFGAWVQDAHYPPCPDCGEQMTHLLQLNVEGQLPATDGSHLHLADGLCYIYWCDRCAISTYLLQYT